MFSCRYGRRFLGTGLVLALLLSSLCYPAGAQQSLAEDTSLGIVPADAAFYTATLNNRLQWEKFVESKAYEHLMETQIVQLAKLQLQGMWENPPHESVSRFKEWITQPENQELHDLVLDAFSHETFLYGGGDFSHLLVLMNRLNNVSNMAQLESLRTEESHEEIFSRRVLEILNENPQALRVPDLVFGFKVSDTERAQRQIDRLESELKELFRDQEQLAESVKQVQIQGRTFVAIQLDGSQLPWDQLTQEQLQKENFAQLVDKVKQMTLTITIGLRDDYLLVSIGDTNEHLERLGSGQSLADLPEMEPIKELSDRTLTNINYVSRDFLQRAASVDQQIADFNAMLTQLATLAEVDQEVQEELKTDLAQWSERLKSFVPTPGAVSSAEFLTERGYEGYTYDWSEFPYTDGSQPLPILKHVGTEPILFTAARQKPSPEGYELLADLIRRGVYYGEKIGLEKLEPNERETYQKLRDALQPLAKRWDEITRQQLIPAFQDGQSALVVEAQLTSTQWHVAMPESEIPLPMLEIAIVCGVSDAEKARTAFAELFEALQEALVRVREAAPERLPDVTLPHPEVLEVAGGTLYKYTPPEDWGLDDQLALTGGLSQDYFTISISPLQATRLLDARNLDLPDGPLTAHDGPMASASYFNFPRLVDTLIPWVDYAVLTGTGGGSVEENPAAMQIQDWVHPLLDVLKCWKGYQSVSYFEDDVMVTHHQWHFEDLP